MEVDGVRAILNQAVNEAESAIQGLHGIKSNTETAIQLSEQVRKETVDSLGLVYLMRVLDSINTNVESLRSYIDAVHTYEQTI